MEITEYVNSAFLQRKFIKRLDYKKHDAYFENVFLFEKESDILSLKNGLIHEFEFKIGQSDFKKDLHKRRHQIGKPNFFYYVLSNESIIKGQYLQYAGIYIHSFSSDGQSLFKLIKEPERIREHPITADELYSLLTKISRRING